MQKYYIKLPNSIDFSCLRKFPRISSWKYCAFFNFCEFTIFFWFYVVFTFIIVILLFTFLLNFKRMHWTQILPDIPVDLCTVIQSIFHIQFTFTFDDAIWHWMWNCKMKLVFYINLCHCLWLRSKTIRRHSYFGQSNRNRTHMKHRPSTRDMVHISSKYEI